VPIIAYLTPLVDPDETTIPAPLQIIADDTTLGRDPLQANLVISDPSIESVHARIHHEGKSFLITDAGSVAGTWVNYDPVPPKGTQLEHADIIHLGQVGFRFNLAEPDQLRKVVVTPLESDR
jgi:predicted component of type VI protein secretion system